MFIFFIIHGLHVNVTLLFRYTNLLVVEARGEREHAGARIQREHVVRPVGDEHVAQLTVGTLCVGVRSDDLAHAAAPRHVFGDVERIGRALEGRRVVIGVGNLKNDFSDFLLAMERYMNHLKVMFLSHRRVDDAMHFSARVKITFFFFFFLSIAI